MTEISMKDLAKARAAAASPAFVDESPPEGVVQHRCCDGSLWVLIDRPIRPAAKEWVPVLSDARTRELLDRAGRPLPKVYAAYLEDILDRAEAELQENRAALSRLARDRDEALDDAAYRARVVLEADLRAEKRAAADLADRYASLSKSYDDLVKRGDDDENRIEALEKEVAELQASNLNAANALARATSEIGRLQKQREETAERLQNALAGAQTSAEEQRARADNLDGLLSMAYARGAADTKTIEKLKAEDAELRARASSLEDDVARLETVLKEEREESAASLARLHVTITRLKAEADRYVEEREAAVREKIAVECDMGIIHSRILEAGYADPGKIAAALKRAEIHGAEINAAYKQIVESLGGRIPKNPALAGAVAAIIEERDIYKRIAAGVQERLQAAFAILRGAVKARPYPSDIVDAAKRVVASLEDARDALEDARLRGCPETILQIRTRLEAAGIEGETLTEKVSNVLRDRATLIEAGVFQKNVEHVRIVAMPPGERLERLRRLQTALAEKAAHPLQILDAPVAMILHCPACGARHVDDGEWAEKPHHTHACQECGVVWRPAVIHTVGVQYLPGFKDET